MHHFMHKGSKYLYWFSLRKMARIKRYLVRYFLWISRIRKPFTGEIAKHSFMALHGYQTRGETAIKKFSIKKIISSRQAGICLRCWIMHIRTIYYLYRTKQLYYIL